MKRRYLVALLTAIMVMASTAVSWAASDFTLVSSYPEDGQKNTSMENVGVKLTFSNPVNSDTAKATDESLIKMYDEDGGEVPIKVLFSDNDDGLVLAVADSNDEDFTVKNNADYKLVIDADFVDNDGNTLGTEQTITFKTYNQKVNNIVNMVMMFVMFGGIMVISMRQNMKKEEDEPKKEEPKEVAFNPYKEAKRTGKSVEEIVAAHEKEEAKAAKRKARKKKKEEETVNEKKIENCAELLTNVYHVHAPAPISKEDRSVEALKKMRKPAKVEYKTKKTKKK